MPFIAVDPTSSGFGDTPHPSRALVGEPGCCACLGGWPLGGWPRRDAAASLLLRVPMGGLAEWSDSGAACHGLSCTRAAARGEERRSTSLYCGWVGACGRATCCCCCCCCCIASLFVCLGARCGLRLLFCRMDAAQSEKGDGVGDGTESGEGGDRTSDEPWPAAWGDAASRAPDRERVGAGEGEGSDEKDELECIECADASLSALLVRRRTRADASNDAHTPPTPPPPPFFAPFFRRLPASGMPFVMTSAARDESGDAEGERSAAEEEEGGADRSAAAVAESLCRLVASASRDAIGSRVESEEEECSVVSLRRSRCGTSEGGVERRCDEGRKRGEKGRERRLG